MRLLNGDAYFIYTGMDNTLDSETLLKFRNALALERSLSMRNALIKTRFYKEKRNWVGAKINAAIMSSQMETSTA